MPPRSESVVKVVLCGGLDVCCVPELGGVLLPVPVPVPVPVLGLGLGIGIGAAGIDGIDGAVLSFELSSSSSP